VTLVPRFTSIESMLQGMSKHRGDACAADARAHERHAAGVEYPRWYLKRWHFLPEGYLSRRSAWGYDAVIRRVYHVVSEPRTLRAVINQMGKRPPEQIVDLGCGPGRAVKAFAQAFQGAKLTGVDLSPFLLERAENRLAGYEDQVRLVHADATELPIEHASADAVFASHLVGHLPPQKAGDVLAEAKRILRTTGRLYLVDHSWHPMLTPGFRTVGERKLNRGLICLRWLEPA